MNTEQNMLKLCTSISIVLVFFRDCEMSIDHHNTNCDLYSI